MNYLIGLSAIVFGLLIYLSNNKPEYIKRNMKSKSNMFMYGIFLLVLIVSTIYFTNEF